MTLEEKLKKIAELHSERIKIETLLQIVNKYEHIKISGHHSNALRQMEKEREIVITNEDPLNIILKDALIAFVNERLLINTQELNKYLKAEKQEYL